MFYKGNKVVRIDGNSQFNAACNSRNMTIGGPLTVSSADAHNIILMEVSGSWDATKFTLYETPALPNQSVVTTPSHYQFFEGVEAIEIIAMTLTVEGFRGYCLGNRLKYRLRAGKKDDPKQELDKSDFYCELFEKHKHLCRSKP